MAGKTLPQPPGPYNVGTGTCELVDQKRTLHLLSEVPGRKIRIKFWYPATNTGADDSTRETLWAELRTEAQIPKLVKFVLRRVTNTTTNSYLNAPYAVAVGAPRIVIYNHGMISFASENTMLMEHLASYGYTVLALQHKDQLPELQALQKALPAALRKEQAMLLKQLQRAAGSKRAELSSHYFRIASNTNRIVGARTLDVEYAVQNINEILASLAGLADLAAARIIGVAGLSLGGAVATEYSRNNPAIGWVVNIDGGNYGEHQDVAITHPYLMLYSEENNGSNELSLRTDSRSLIRQELFQNTRHLNFHDIACFYPVLKWLKATGKADAAQVIDRRNRLIKDFIANLDAS